MLAERLQSGCRVGGFLFVCSYLAFLPARIGQGLVSRPGDSVPFIIAASGLDIQTTAPAFYLCYLILLILSPLLRRRSEGTSLVFFSAFMLGLLALAYILSVAAVEFALQRGMFPTWFDIENSRGDIGLVLKYLATYLEWRYLVPFLATGLCFLAAVLFFGRGVSPFAIHWVSQTATLVVVALLSAATFRLWLDSGSLFPSIGKRSKIKAPFADILKPFGRGDRQVFRGMSTVLQELEFSDLDYNRGLQLLGWRQKPSSNCRQHPFRIPMGAEGHSGHLAPVIAELRELAERTVGADERPIVFWHVVLESIRADDLHGINDAAPPEAAPFLNRLYQSADEVEGFGALRSSRFFQAGTRTSAAFSAITCGLGTLSHNLSMSRDLGTLPVRCLPDLLRDAGYTSRLFTGVNLTFDNMERFARYHGFKTYDQFDFHQRYPERSGEIPDLFLLKAVADLVADENLPGDEYNLIFTISSHSPFEVPFDFPDAFKSEVDHVLKGTHRSPSELDRRRIMMLRYVDHAVQQFVVLAHAQAKARNKQAVILLHGDHSILDPFLWQNIITSDHSERVKMKSTIPFLWLIPQDGESADMIARMNQRLQQLSISQNDTPHLLAALLLHSRATERIDVSWRWHSMGSQGLWPGPYHQGSVWGTSAESRSYVFDRLNKLRVYGAHQPISVPTDLLKGGVLDDALAPLGQFMKGYASRCWHPRYIRLIAHGI